MNPKNTIKEVVIVIPLQDMVFAKSLRRTGKVSYSKIYCRAGQQNKKSQFWSMVGGRLLTEICL